METEFWHQRWAKNEIGFHQDSANPLLTNHITALSLSSGDRIFIPLCGKTRDIAWLLSQGYHLIGAELSTTAIEQLFSELGVEPDIRPLGSSVHYHTDKLDIYVGDIFELSAQQLGPINAIYDRAALVALPQAMRVRYSEHLLAITATAPQLLISYEYDQQCLPGPPFAITGEEVAMHYEKAYHLALLTTVDIPGGLKGKCPSTESVWLLTPKATDTTL